MKPVATIPFVIGITGHRDPLPEKVVELGRSFKGVLDWVHQCAPHTPILILSGLAAGCDQLAARWALEWGAAKGDLADGSARIRLGCLLPLERDEYLRDFENDPVALTGFLELEARASFVLRMTEAQSVSERVVEARHGISRPTGALRDACYERLGNFLADRSQLLVAFWNQIANGKRGGTSHVVRMIDAIRGAGSERIEVPGRGERHVLMHQDVAVLEVIRTDRRSVELDGERDPLPRASIVASPPDHRDAERLSRHLRELDVVNGGLLRHARRASGTGTDAALPPGGGLTERRFEVLDAMAVHAKKLFVFNVLGLTAITVLAVWFFQWFGTHDKEYTAAWGYLASMLLVLGWYRLLRMGSGRAWWGRIGAGADWLWLLVHCEWLFVYCRAGAEALRVQIAWADAGLPDAVTDHYMARRSRDTAFLRQFVRAASVEMLLRTPSNSAVGHEPDGLVWVRDQVSYMRCKVENSGRREPGIVTLFARIVRRVMTWWWMLILLISLLLAFVSYGHSAGAHRDGVRVLHFERSPLPSRFQWCQIGEEESWLPFGVFVVGSLLFLKVGIEYHDAAVLAKEDVESYERLLPVFEQALMRLEASTDKSESRKVLRAVGKESIDEQAEWFVRHLNSLRFPNVG
jgi:hypothetical protein